MPQVIPPEPWSARQREFNNLPLSMTGLEIRTLATHSGPRSDSDSDEVSVAQDMHGPLSHLPDGVECRPTCCRALQVANFVLGANVLNRPAVALNRVR